MKEIKIYQINQEKDINRVKFNGIKFLEELGYGFDISIYEKVWEGKIDADTTLDEVFEMFNINHPKDFKGHSLSISDLIVCNGTTWFVDRFGFKKIRV